MGCGCGLKLVGGRRTRRNRKYRKNQRRTNRK